MKLQCKRYILLCCFTKQWPMMLQFLTSILVLFDPFGIVLQVESFLDDATSKVCLSIMSMKLLNVDLDKDHQPTLVH